MEAFGNSIDKYEVYEVLGKGSFATVHRAYCHQSGMEVAIKMINRKLMNASGMSNRVKQEVEIHSRLQHPSVLKLHTCFEDQEYVYLVLELCHSGELQRYLKTTKAPLSETEARIILKQVVEGLLYLHSHNIVHRDMTLANLLITKDMNIKIGDFGLATQLTRPDEKHMTMCGTPNYISPEIATRAAHGLETDVWGLGVMLYTILVGKTPFDTDHGIKSTLTLVVMSEIEFPKYFSPEVQDLIYWLLKKNPRDRIKLSKILEHPFMTRYQSMFSSSGRWGGSHDSGVVTSSCMTFQSYSRSKSELSSFLSTNILPPRATQPLFSRTSSSSVPTSSGDLQRSLPPSFRNPAPTQMTTNNCSCCSHSSNHLCPSGSKNISGGDWQNTEHSYNPGLRCPLGPGSGGTSAAATNNLRCYSNSSSVAFKDTNYSHAGNQYDQCSHADTCGCLHNQNSRPDGCSGHSNVLS
ncbi:unnamed protein product [Orchesella dallaii]|uniref:Protein kinase domain-containing protein n=1 Tax=Orchesella dallaii TaxID=48710 RepID=A0ABP1RQQ8_9HEXA